MPPTSSVPGKGRGRAVGKHLEPPIFPWLYFNPDLEEQNEDDPKPILPSSDDPPQKREMITVQAGIDDIFIPLYYGGPHRDGAIIVFADQHTSGPHRGKLVVMYLHGWGPLGLINNHTFENDKSNAIFGIEIDVRTGLNNTVSPILQAIWPTCSAYPGLAYTVARFPIDPFFGVADPYSYRVSIPQGLLIRDSRVSMVNRAFSSNVALVRADLWTNKRYALGRLDSAVDFTTVNEAANDCDFLLANGSKRFQIALKVDDDNYDRWDTNIGLHAQMFTGTGGGKYQMFVDKPRTPSGLVLSDTGAGHQIVGGSFRLKDVSEVQNEVSFEYISASNDFKTEKATTRHPGLDNGTLLETIPITYSTKGSPSYDQSKRLSIWGFNRIQLSDKEYFLDTVYDGGVQCVPGMLINVSSRDFDWSNQLAIVRVVTRRGLGFRLKLEKYDVNIYSDTPQTDQAVPAPFGPDPYATVPDPEGCSVTPVYGSPLDSTAKSGVYLNVVFSRPSIYPYYSRVRLTVTRTKVGEATQSYIFLEPTEGPVQIPAAADGATYTVLLQTISTRNILSAGVSIPTIPAINPPEPPGLFLGDRTNGWYWDAPKVRTQITFPTASWSATNLTTFVASAIQNGVKTVTSLKFGTGTGAERILILDTGVGGTKIDEFVMYFTNQDYTDAIDSSASLAPNHETIPVLEYSNSLAGPWLTYETNTSLQARQRGVSSRDRKSLTWQINSAVVGTPRYWRFYQFGPYSDGSEFLNEISEIETYAYSAVSYVGVAGYQITQVIAVENNVYKYATKRIYFQPTSTNRLKKEDLEVIVRGDPFPLYGGYSSVTYYQKAFIHTISATGALSAPRELNGTVFLVGSPANAIGEDQDFQPVNEFTVSLTSSTNNDLEIDNISALVQLGIGSVGNKTITGMKYGYKARRLLLKNTSTASDYIILEHENAGSVAENRFSFSPAVQRIMPPGTTLQLYYDPTLLRWTNGVAQEVRSDTNASFASIVTNGGSGTASSATFRTAAAVAGLSRVSHGPGNTASRFGKVLANWNEILHTSGNGLILGTLNAVSVILGTNSLAAMEIDSNQYVSVAKTLVTAGLGTPLTNGVQASGLYSVSWTNAQVTTSGATFDGNILVCTLPAKVALLDAFIIIGSAASGVATLTVSLGRTAATYNDYIVPCDAKAAAGTIHGNSAAERGANMTGFDLPSATGTTAINLHFTSTGTQLSTVTNSTGTVYLNLLVLP